MPNPDADAAALEIPQLRRRQFAKQRGSGSLAVGHSFSYDRTSPRHDPPILTPVLKDLLAIAIRGLLVVTAIVVGYFVLVVAVHFPYDTGHVELPPVEENVDAKSYYENVYKTSIQDAGGSDHEYVGINRSTTNAFAIFDEINEFVELYGLAQARTLEVGAGSGQLQDLVDDYTGLDIAKSAARFFHKPFVLGSALDLPFGDSTFDAVWTVWTLEHVPDPEKAMREIRRVTKPGGMIFFFPAWNCTSWAATGLEIRPYTTLSLTEKVSKASLAIRADPLFRFSYVAPTRLIRYAMWRAWTGPTRLRYTALQPNYTNYWALDSDATASLDPAESKLWFESRGDRCLNCPGSATGLALAANKPLHIRVAKD